jgi:hypothetical protein
MTFKRLGLSYVDPDPRRAQQDRDEVAAVQDLQGVEVAVTSPDTADKEFQIIHGLRYLPRAIETVRISKAGVVYASRLAEWDERRVFAKCSVAGAELLLRVR